MRRVSALVVIAALAAWTTAAQEPKAPKAPAGQAPGSGVATVSGAYAFRTYCASCHGVDGKGEGPLTDSLRFRPPDLTLIAKRNGGEYPADKVTRIVDGRNPVKGHGGPDMPIWGDAFRNAETGFDQEAARAKIRSVVEHLKTIQAK